MLRDMVNELSEKDCWEAVQRLTLRNIGNYKLRSSSLVDSHRKHAVSLLDCHIRRINSNTLPKVIGSPTS